MDRTELLQRYYDGFINLTTPQDFFIGLTDYLEYADSVPEFERITAELTVKRKEYEDKLNELSKIGIVVLDKLKGEFETYVKKHSIENQVIKNSFKEYDSWKAGLIRGSSPLIDNLHDLLCDVVRALYELPEHKEYASKYIEFWKHDKTLIKNYLPIKEVKDFFDLNEEYNELSKSELWGQVNILGWIFQVIKHGRNKHKELVNKLETGNDKARAEASFELLWSYNPLYGAWKNIQAGKSTQNTIGGSFFDVNTTRPIIIRLHNYILSRKSILDITNKIVEEYIEKLGEKSKITNPEDSTIPTNFSPSLSVQGKFGYLQIYKKGKKLKIAGMDTRQFKLIKALFSPENSLTANYTETYHAYDRIFGFIEIKKDKTNKRLKDSATMKNEMCSVIQYTIKEIQKNKIIRDYLKFDWRNDTQLRMIIVLPEGKS